MYSNDPVSLLSLHHSEHTELVNRATTASARPLRALHRSVSSAYYATVRRAYLHARAARLSASRATL